MGFYIIRSLLRALNDAVVLRCVALLCIDIQYGRNLIGSKRTLLLEGLFLGSRTCGLTLRMILEILARVWKNSK